MEQRWKPDLQTLRIMWKKRNWSSPCGRCKNIHRSPSSENNYTMRTSMRQIETNIKNVSYLIAHAISFIDSFLVVWHNEWPENHNVGNDFNQRWHLQIVCVDTAAETGSRHHPVTVFCSFQASNNKFGHREGVEAGQNIDDTFWRCLFSNRKSKIG